MDVLIPVALLLVGLIIGFFVARYVYTKEAGNKSVKQAEKNVKEILNQQAEHHLYQTRQTVEAIEAQCQTLRAQVEEYESLLKQGTGEEETVPFYGEHAATYLRNNIKGREKASVTSVHSTQPKDFANTGSGLFVGTIESSTAEKENK
ncbi:YhcB family protein [Salinimonas marina]|uniref:YhcB family protein n=1 Tax=Salinimonas marina TaxID=2785918 RepID=A0A7S9HD41_9ALTE|nr:DUF1043 family protein [Salinimonas marina]QPG05161.1 YhcB family protein [Salinimonas marina]